MRYQGLLTWQTAYDSAVIWPPQAVTNISISVPTEWHFSALFQHFGMVKYWNINSKFRIMIKAYACCTLRDKNNYNIEKL